MEYSLEWPTAYLSTITLVAIHLACATSAPYQVMLQKNRDLLSDLGIFLFLTVGGFAFSAVASRRILRIICLSLAGCGVVLLTLKVRT